MGRTVRLNGPAQRIVSLVPSETASVYDLVGLDRLVGRTDYCIEPTREIETVPSVGGTKGFDVDAVCDLGPDLVLANKEENGRPLVQSMIERGLTVHVSFPCTCASSNRYLEQLAALVGVAAESSPVVQRCKDALGRAEPALAPDALPVFVPIWRDPWMTFDGRAYASDVLRVCGARNVFEDRERRYPLAADLGRADAWSPEKVDQRDTRYPRIQLEEIVSRGALAVLLPDEPYAFGESDFDVFRSLPGAPPIVTLVDGKDLFWYGSRLAGAIDRLSKQIAILSTPR